MRKEPSELGEGQQLLGYREPRGADGPWGGLRELAGAGLSGMSWNKSGPLCPEVVGDGPPLPRQESTRGRGTGREQAGMSQRDPRVRGLRVWTCVVWHDELGTRSQGGAVSTPTVGLDVAFPTSSKVT